MIEEQLIYPWANPDIQLGRFNVDPWGWVVDHNLNSGDEVAYEYVKDEGKYYVDTSDKPAMLVLPPRPRPGFRLTVVDHYGSWKFYPLTVHRNGNLIMGGEEHLRCDVPNMVFSLIYAPETRLGWVVHFSSPGQV